MDQGEEKSEGFGSESSSSIVHIIDIGKVITFPQERGWSRGKVGSARSRQERAAEKQLPNPAQRRNF